MIEHVKHMNLWKCEIAEMRTCKNAKNMKMWKKTKIPKRKLSNYGLLAHTTVYGNGDL